jgi:hypothetical protein
MLGGKLAELLFGEAHQPDRKRHLLLNGRDY